ncbi:tail protein X [Rickettsia asiatica]|uniref:tail protein X n=1 Tax=Rickettsia asiatica TaxID=238800 RepID=UPI0038CD8A51
MSYGKTISFDEAISCQNPGVATLSSFAVLLHGLCMPFPRMRESSKTYKKLIFYMFILSNM